MSTLRVVIRTPHETVLDLPVHSARFPTETGLVGLRPGEEPLLFVVDAGLVVLNAEEGRRFAATAGGLLDGTRQTCMLLTPFAVAGGDEGEVVAALDRALSTPDAELTLRKRIGELEQRIVRELKEPRPYSTVEVHRG